MEKEREAEGKGDHIQCKHSNNIGTCSNYVVSSHRMMPLIIQLLDVINIIVVRVMVVM